MRISDWSSDVCSSDLVVAEVAGEAGQVVGGVAQAQDLLADEVADGGGAERVGVALGGDQGELFDYEPVHAGALHFLTSYEVESKRVCVSQEQWRSSHILWQSVVRKQEGQLVAGSAMGCDRSNKGSRICRDRKSTRLKSSH